jgi:adenylate cyclase class IV
MNASYLKQRDAYFQCPEGRRLKFREFSWNRAEVILYARAYESEGRVSEFERVEIVGEGNVSGMAKVLECLHEPIVTVIKLRTAYRCEGVRVHLDEVDDLGTFVEIEIILDADETEGSGKMRFAETVSRLELGVVFANVLPGSYCDMLMALRAPKKSSTFDEIGGNKFIC